MKKKVNSLMKKLFPMALASAVSISGLAGCEDATQEYTGQYRGFNVKVEDRMDSPGGNEVQLRRIRIYGDSGEVIYAIDGDTSDNPGIDEIRFNNVPQGSPLEQLGTREELERAYKSVKKEN